MQLRSLISISVDTQKAGHEEQRATDLALVFSNVWSRAAWRATVFVFWNTAVEWDDHNERRSFLVSLFISGGADDSRAPQYLVSRGGPTRARGTRACVFNKHSSSSCFCSVFGELDSLKNTRSDGWPYFSRSC